MLEEAQKVYVRRDEEKWKAKAKIMKSAEAELKTPEIEVKEPPPAPPRQPAAAADRTKHFCTYCNQAGHGTWYCFRKARDEKAQQVENQIANN